MASNAPRRVTVDALLAVAGEGAMGHRERGSGGTLAIEDLGISTLPRD